MRQPWNHNLHYHPFIHHAVPAGCQHALDVGCGVGTLARELRAAVPQVTAIDRDEACIARARAEDPAGEVDYVLGDFLAHPFPDGTFDLVTSVAALHHMDATAALTRMRRLLRPGGALAVVGLARSDLPRDVPIEIAAILANLAYRARRGYWEQPAPAVWPPYTYAQMRALAAESLAGSRFRRRLLWRYSLLWTKPAT